MPIWANWRKVMSSFRLTKVGVLEYFFTMEKLVQAQYNIGHKISNFKTSLRE